MSALSVVAPKGCYFVVADEAGSQSYSERAGVFFATAFYARATGRRYSASRRRDPAWVRYG